MPEEYELIICVVNAGYSEFYGITIHPEKDMVMILVKKEIKDEILKEIHQRVGLPNEGQGIVFSVPVDDVVGRR